MTNHHRAQEGVHIVARLAKVVELALASENLTLNQYRLLTLIDEADYSGARLSKRLGMKVPNISRAIEALVRRGLVSRETHANDGRRVTLHLSAEGTTALAAANERCARALSSVSDDPSSLDSLATWRPGLDRAAANLDDRD